MDISQYKDLIQNFVIVAFVMLSVDAILKIAFLDKTFADLLIRIGIVLITVFAGFIIITKTIS